MRDLDVTIDRELLELMPHVVTFERCTGLDEFGQRQYETPLRIRARVEGRMRKVVGADGMERMSSVQVFLSSSPGITPNDRITLPAEFQPRQPNILGVERQADEGGAFYEMVLS